MHYTCITFNLYNTIIPFLNIHFWKVTPFLIKLKYFCNNTCVYLYSPGKNTFVYIYDKVYWHYNSLKQILVVWSYSSVSKPFKLHIIYLFLKITIRNPVTNLYTKATCIFCVFVHDPIHLFPDNGALVDLHVRVLVCWPTP